MPSLWFEGFGLIAMEAMLRGLPVISSDAGGLVEAKRGTDYIIPVRPIEHFERAFDETHMPKPVDVPQDITPWADALQRLLRDREEYERESRTSRAAAVEFVSRLRAADFEDLLERLTPGVAAPATSGTAKPAIDALSPAKRALLLQRLRTREKR
jgi:glycosyltransferase involved in cell wall biosynthesis